MSHGVDKRAGKQVWNSAQHVDQTTSLQNVFPKTIGLRRPSHPLANLGQKLNEV